jgi:hypothetical protein
VVTTDTLEQSRSIPTSTARARPVDDEFMNHHP